MKSDYAILSTLFLFIVECRKYEDLKKQLIPDNAYRPKSEFYNRWIGLNQVNWNMQLFFIKNSN